MAEEETNGAEGAPASKLPLIIVGGVLVAVLLAGGFLFLSNQGGNRIQVEKAPAEYVVGEKMYQLKDGSYLKLGFSIVVDEDQVGVVRNIIEKEAPGRLPSSITMLLGNKSREELISGTHKREAFAREIKKLLEERVFSNYNKKQISAEDTIEVREVLISDFVTQNG